MIKVVSADKAQPKEVPTFQKASRVQREVRPEQTEADIRAWVKGQIQADQKTLDLLATL